MSPASSHRSEPIVGIVVVSYHSDDVLPGLLASVAEASAGLPFRGIVADNAADGAAAALATAHDFDYLPLDNRGYGSAVNAAVRTLPRSVEWVLVTNPDVVLQAGAIEELVRHGRSSPDIGAVGPRVRNDDGTVYPSARAIPSLRTGIGHAVLGPLWPRNPWTVRYLRSNELGSESPRDAGWLSGSCLVIRRSAFEAVDGFDERYFMYFEDVDLGFRLARSGWRNVYDPRAVVRHTGGTSTAGAHATMLAEHHRSASLFLEQKYPGRVLAPLRSALNLGLRLRSALTLRRRRP